METSDDMEQRAKMLRAETETLLQSPDFIRSPVMSQLLRYLVEEAISNPNNPPKAYQVAVDGLGRTDDFDVQTDSYPRVQVGRLRKMLAAYYAARGTAERLRIPIGHYAVELQTGGITAEGKTGSATPIDDGLFLSLPAEKGLKRWLSHRPATYGLAALVFLGAVGLLWFLNSDRQDIFSTANASDYILPPKIYIERPQRAQMGPDKEKTNELELFFEDAFASSSQVRLAVADRPGGAFEETDGENAYLFKSELVAGQTGPRVKFSLTSLMQDENIWSSIVTLPDSPDDYPEKLGPLAGRIASIYGVISTDQRKHLPDDAMIGYACLLRFENYRSHREPDLLSVVESCIEKSLAADPLDSRILAAASFMAYLREEATGRKPDPKAGFQFARRAMVLGREDASANFALARSSFFNGNCARGKEFAEKAVELAPYEATVQAQTGAYLFGCNDPDATKYLRRAIALDPRGSIVAETALVLSLLEEGKNREALEFAEKIVPSSTGVGPYYDIAMAAVYASNSRNEESQTSWDRLVELYGKENDESAEQLLNRLIINPDLADRVFVLLSQTGVISDEQARK
ncbi:tetratricopeptide repeat protein [Parasphingorhabdus sp.]|uniref:tetratricopeptide repeat protein n=1 Tax=Parasphingorhabdus sp. TaxID=2709688 RepID=UPI003A8DF520